jgi:hypothetical protein
MKLAIRKLDFLVLYILGSLTTLGLVRSMMIKLMDWVSQFPILTSNPENF